MHGGDLEVYARTAWNARLFSWSVDTENGQLDNAWSLEDFVNGHNIDLVNSDDGDHALSRRGRPAPGGPRARRRLGGLTRLGLASVARSGGQSTQRSE